MFAKRQLIRPQSGVFCLLFCIVGCATGASANDASSSSGAPDRNSPIAVRAPSVAGFKDAFAEVNGVRLHYRIGGEGSAVVLLHGYTQTGYMWHPIMPLLAEHHTVIVPDLRGAGESGAKDFAALSAKKLDMPFLVLTGEKASGTFLVEQTRLVATNVSGTARVGRNRLHRVPTYGGRSVHRDEIG